jgi:hypothetical protein
MLKIVIPFTHNITGLNAAVFSARISSIRLDLLPMGDISGVDRNICRQEDGRLVRSWGGPPFRHKNDSFVLARPFFFGRLKTTLISPGRTESTV